MKSYWRYFWLGTDRRKRNGRDAVSEAGRNLTIIPRSAVNRGAVRCSLSSGAARAHLAAFGGQSCAWVRAWTRYAQQPWRFFQNVSRGRLANHASAAPHAMIS